MWLDEYTYVGTILQTCLRTRIQLGDISASVPADSITCLPRSSIRLSPASCYVPYSPPEFNGPTTPALHALPPVAPLNPTRPYSLSHSYESSILIVVFQSNQQPTRTFSSPIQPIIITPGYSTEPVCSHILSCHILPASSTPNPLSLNSTYLHQLAALLGQH